MFEAAELGQSITAKEFAAREQALWRRLLLAQRDLRARGKFPVIIDFAGVHGAGKVGMVNVLNRWMDARWIATHAYGEVSDEERQRPALWRFWRDLPPKGQIGLYLSGRYSRPLLSYVYGELTLDEFDKALDQIRAFERTLADDGALILKFWMHLSRAEQKRRLKALEKDPLERWRVTDTDWKHWKLYDRFVEAGEHVIAKTSTIKTPWHIVEGTDYAYRSLQTGQIIADAIERHIERVEAQRQLDEQLRARIDNNSTAPPAGDKAAASEPPLTILHSLDLSRRLTKKDYNAQIRQLTSELNQLHHRANERGISTVAVFEGPDAAGKGGVIRRLIGAFDAPNYRVFQFSAPSKEELSHHYLWRFWRCFLPAGKITIFDRSWYGRVLVERVEAFADEHEWGRAYAELNDFEAQLVDHKVVLLKFWIHISADEQLARFNRRKNTPHKAWKLTEEDWRNREKWTEYHQAAHDMIQHTSTMHAPWTLIEGNDKLHSRIKIMKTVCEKMAAALAG